MTANPFPRASRILILAALPQEIAAFKRDTGPWNRLTRSVFPTWRCDREDRSLMLVQTGMGSRRLADAFAWATSLEGCELLVSFGFGGGLTPDLRIGDLCLCHRFCRWDPSKQSLESHGLAVSHGPWRTALDTALPFRACIDVTTPRLASKQRVGRHLRRFTGSSPALIDMESFTLAHLAWEASLPFVALRAVSDELADEFDFDLSSISDDGGNLCIPRVVTTLLGRPGLLGPFFRLWLDSRKAASSLCRGAAALVQLPSTRLGDLLKASIVREWHIPEEELDSAKDS